MWFSRKDDIFTEERMINAVEYNDISFMKEYIKNGYNVSFNTFDESNPNLLFYARSAEAVKLLVQAGIDINAKSSYEKNGNTALHYAVFRNNIELIQSLVQEKADVNVLNTQKITPFMAALQTHNLKAVQLMMHANPDFQVTDSHRNTALHYLSLWENEKESKELFDLRLAFIQGGADVTLQNDNGKKPSQLIAFKPSKTYIIPENIGDKILVLSQHPLKKIKKSHYIHTKD